MRALLLAASMAAAGLATTAALVACHHADAPPPQPPAGSAAPGVVDTDARPAHAHGRVVVTDARVDILDPIRFEGVSAVVRPSGIAMLDAIAHTLDGNPSIVLVGVHTFGADAPPAQQLHLAQDRAKVVIAYLVAHGIAAARLEPRPAAVPPHGQDDRVEFEILRRAGE